MTSDNPFGQLPVALILTGNALGVGSFLMAKSTATGVPAVAQPAANLTPQVWNGSAFVASGDTLAGQWESSQSLVIGSVGIWVRSV